MLAEPGKALPQVMQWPLLAPAGAPDARPVAVSPRRAANHHILLAAPFAHMELPPEIALFYATGAPAIGGLRFAGAAMADRPLLGADIASSAGASRWSADGWLLWRDGSGQAVAPGAASYGRSQAGAVVRYRLLEHGMLPEAYVRVTRSAEGPRQADLAAGLSARPIPAVPLRIAVEMRVTEMTAGREVRPAAFVVTELPAASLPLGLRAEGYAQAGWVGGDYATAFVDGQVRVDRELVRFGGEQSLRAGLGAWGGAQKGAERLDVGPSATVGLRLGAVRSRLALDYRVRVAGNAMPESGPAVTFSAGF